MFEHTASIFMVNRSQYFTLKFCYKPTKLHGVIIQKVTISVFTTVWTANTHGPVDSECTTSVVEVFKGWSFTVGAENTFKYLEGFGLGPFLEGSRRHLKDGLCIEWRVLLWEESNLLVLQPEGWWFAKCLRCEGYRIFTVVLCSTWDIFVCVCVCVWCVGVCFCACVCVEQCRSQFIP